MAHQQVEKSLAENIGLLTPRIEIYGRVRRVVTVTANEGGTYFAIILEDRSEPYRVCTREIEMHEAVALIEPGTSVRLTVKANLAEFETSASYFPVVSRPEVVGTTI